MNNELQKDIPKIGGPYNRISESYYLRAKELMTYNPDTGIFIWSKTSKSSNRSKGQVVGNIRDNRVRIGITIGGKQKHIQAHKLALFFINGSIPTIVDHRNMDSSDNRICNLRQCTHAQNLRNRVKAKNNKTGYKGVHKRHNRYIAGIRHNQKTIHLGSFETAIEAAKIYDSAAIELHGEFVQTNFRRKKNV